ncbi:MAG: hypothetical protein HW389_2339 [Bacteroidetes bacterium]|nr:hypothetical protein [Bacteroidota bacterium]
MTKLILIMLISCARMVAQSPPVYVVLFTHIEDNTPTGTLGSPESRNHYLLVRSKMIEMANLTLRYDVKWLFQPDWKILLAALMYEDSATRSNTNGKNFLRYVKEDLGAIIDPHSHEKLGYNYTDVAHLLDSLGVGGSTVIGGHVWDPSLPQFANWDRFRIPVRGTQYPWAVWRGTILMGSGTPNHVNDPHVSGVWRPRDRFHYFVDDPVGNIACIGQYKSDIATIDELIGLYAGGSVSREYMLTSSYHITPSSITDPNGLVTIENTVLKPLAALRSQNKVRLTDFTSLILEWQSTFNGKAFVYDPDISTGIQAEPYAPESIVLHQNYPTRFNPATAIIYRLMVSSFVTLKVFDALGREVVTLADEIQDPGIHQVLFNVHHFSLAAGVYFYQLRVGRQTQTRALVYQK